MKKRPIWALVFALIIMLATAHKARVLGSPDFKVFYTAARMVWDFPELIYQEGPDRYLYPPSTAMLLYPFAFSENYSMHQWIWHGLLGLAVFLITRRSWPSFFALLILTRYLTLSFFYGQVNLFILSLFLAVEVNLARKRSGVFWALATSVKVFPLVLVPAFALKKNYRGLVIGLLSLLLILSAPFWAFGWGFGLYMYQEFLRALGDKGLPLHSHNQSIAALLMRLFTQTRFHLHAVDDVSWTLVPLRVELVRAFAWVISLSMVGLTWRHAYKQKRADTLVAASAFSFLFLSHIVWKDYLLFLFFPLKELLTHIPRNRAIALGLFVVLWITLTSPDVVGFQVSARLDAACVHLWLAILVWVQWKRRN